jgi:uncharacterized protein YndB with AHSA1/START domain
MSEPPVQATAQVEVLAPPADVWQVLVDAAGWSSWYPDIRSVAADGPLRTGDAFSFRTGPVAVEASVEESVDGELLRFSGRSRGSTAVYEFRLRAQEGGTAVSAEQTMSGPAARAMRPMLQKIAETSLPEWLSALRLRVEGAS